MVRPPLPEEARERGRRLGELLRRARGELTVVQVSALSGVPAETLRKIEAGRVPTPAFFTVAAVATALGVPLDALASACREPAAAGAAPAG
ncbi:helix-turn-helix domain-containing protein [Kineococcus indalonis]|uniref:helix-turn-helix domain-containing protein n=1 Tax=Kineococcus indalonis TaxID=2696566 RepID=UPI0014122BCF|nr:helix-turn-helix transcriptional regulator [Kineococcus indalonis]NAZ86933.1 helix-turn-helix domain-containing protein [Kineococcus indalonis]